MNTPPCPQCASVSTVKNGFIHTGKQRYLCKTCHRQFVLNPGRAPLAPETLETVEKLLVERVSLRGSCRVLDKAAPTGPVRVLGISRSWLGRYVNTRAAGVPQSVDLPALKKTHPSRSSSSVTS